MRVARGSASWLSSHGRDLEVNCTWKLATLGRFMLHLGQMGNLCWLLL